MMENNEDKRTPIQAEIERLSILKDNAKRLIKDCAESNDATMLDVLIQNYTCLSAIITTLQSLLEPEKEALIDFAAAYQKEVYYDAFDKSPRTYFDETYTQQTK